MSSVKDKIKLCSTEMNGLIVENINGVPFYERYVEFENTIKKHITDRKYHNMFAQPVFNTTNNMLDWYVSPEFSNAIRLSELRDTQEGEEYSQMKDSAVQYIKRLSTELSEHDQKYLKCLIKHASSEFSDDMVYCQDGKILFAVWGLKLLNGKSLSTSIRTDIDDKRVYSITYTIKGNGVFSGVKGVIKRRHGHVLNGNKDIPVVIPEDGYEFSSWEPDAPHNRTVESDMTFTAVCSKIVVPPPTEEPVVNDVDETTVQPEEPPFSNVRFDGGEHGRIKGLDTVRAKNGEPVPPMCIPNVKAKRGYEFTGWDSDVNEPINGDKVFTAQYKQKERGSLFRGLFSGGGLFGWGRSIFGGFGGGWFSGCLSWLMGAILFGLMIMLLSMLFRGCDVSTPRVPRVSKPVPEHVIPQQPAPVEPQPESQPEEDYDAIRALIKEYEQRIDELEQMLPENQGQISGDENVNTQKPSEYVKI